jgi:hypothetical protein
MTQRTSRWIRLAAMLFVWLVSPGCGGGGSEVVRRTERRPHPDDTLLCRTVPAWRADGSLGLSSAADSTLWPDVPGHFHDWRVGVGLLGAPSAIALTAGGGARPVELSGLGVQDADRGGSCGASYHTRTPDVQVVLDHVAVFMRVYAVPSGESNPTLAIRGPDGRWRCSDDHGRADWGSARAAVVDFCGEPLLPGRYAVWVGSADGSSHNATTLYLTGNPRHHP